MFEYKRTLMVVAAAAAVCVACERPDPNNPAPQTVFVDLKVNVGTVTGFAWDPEAFWFTVTTCPSPCPFPPIRVPGVPTLERAVVNGSQVSLFDPTISRPAFPAAALSTPGGGWYIDKVVSRPAPPFLAVAAPPGPGIPPLKNAGPPTLPAIPAAGYLPTITLKPIFTTFTFCVGQAAGLISTGGILEAVAAHLTAGGRPTVVPDFVDRTKFGGVAVVWLYQPGAPPQRVPAFGTTIGSSVGQVLNIAWASPGSPSARSARGFYVDTVAPVSPLGLSVVLLDPVTGPPSQATFTFADPVTDPATRRPWGFPVLPPQTIAPGIISFVDIQGITPGAPPPGANICLQ
jgi:hypothetical protein